MAFFKYIVKNEHGETIKGKLEARDEHQAALILRERSLLVVVIKPMTEGVLFDGDVLFYRGVGRP